MDESVIPWLNEDLNFFTDSQLLAQRGENNASLIRDSRGEIVCNWRANTSVPAASSNKTAVEVVLPNIHQLLAADLAFSAYTMGKEGGSGHYCPFRRLTKGQWTC